MADCANRGHDHVAGHELYPKPDPDFTSGTGKAAILKTYR
jgi:hypothetical protein